MWVFLMCFGKYENFSVTFIDTTTNAIKHVAYVGRSPHEAFFTPDGKEVWVSVHGEDYVAVLDGQTFSEKTRIVVPMDGRIGLAGAIVVILVALETWKPWRDEMGNDVDGDIKPTTATAPRNIHAVPAE